MGNALFKGCNGQPDVETLAAKEERKPKLDAFRANDGANDEANDEANDDRKYYTDSEQPPPVYYNRNELKTFIVDNITTFTQLENEHMLIYSNYDKCWYLYNKDTKQAEKFANHLYSRLFWKNSTGIYRINNSTYYTTAWNPRLRAGKFNEFGSLIQY